MKIHVKKKRYQAFCREQVVKGLINDEQGNWRPEGQITNKAGVQMMKAGYKLR